MAMTGAERVRKHREKQAAEVKELRATRRELTLTMYKMVEQIANLRRYNKSLRTQLDNARALDWVDRLDQTDDLSPHIWDALSDMTPTQLEAWVKVGRTLASQDDEAPAASRAVEWVHGNIPYPSRP